LPVRGESKTKVKVKVKVKVMKRESLGRRVESDKKLGTKIRWKE
jgi:hypothetical protein